MEDNHQAENLSHVKHEESAAEMCMKVIQEEIPVNMCGDVTCKICPPGRCPSPRYSQDWEEEENVNVLQDHQGVDLIVVKVEDLDGEEEKYMMGVQAYKEEEMPQNISSNGQHNDGTSFCSEPEAYDIKLYSPGQLHSADQSSDPSTESILDITHSSNSKAGTVFPCCECGRIFRKKSHLVQHRFIHTGERPFNCPDCGKSFVRKFSLELHQRNHTGDKPFPCPVCGKRFTFKSSLEAHQIIHTGEKPFPCSECGKCFTNRSNRHQRIHTGEQLFFCSECGKNFTQKTALIKHQRIHTGEQP